MFGQKLARPFARYSAISPATFALLVAAFSSAPALAGGPRVSVSFDFVVPVLLPVRAVHVYDRYYLGRAWFAPHGHAHVIYSFPVHTHGGVVHRPFTYCGERLVRSGYIPWFDPRHDDDRLGYGAPVFDGPAYRAKYLPRTYFERPWARSGSYGLRHGHAYRGQDGHGESGECRGARHRKHRPVYRDGHDRHGHHDD